MKGLNMELTEKEKTALMAIAENGMHGMGGTEPKDLLEDNFSWFYPEDVKERTQFSKAQVAGLIRALNEKELIDDSDRKNEWYLTDKGIEEAQKIWNTRRRFNMIIKTKYIKPAQEVIIEIATYSNHRPAIQIFSLDGMPLMKATLNIPEVELLENEVLIKDYSENEGIMAELQRLNIISETNYHVIMKFVDIPVCVLNPESEWLKE